MESNVVSISLHPSHELNRWLKDGDWGQIAKALEGGLSLHIPWPEGGNLWQRIMLYTGKSLIRPSSMQALHQRNLIRKCFYKSEFSQLDLVAGITQSVWWGRPDLLQLFVDKYPTQTNYVAQGVFEMMVRRKVIIEEHQVLPVLDVYSLTQVLLILKALGAEINGVPVDVLTPLQIAMNIQDEKMFKALLSIESDPLVKNRENISTFEMAISNFNKNELSWMLGSQTGPVLIEKTKPLIEAASHGSLELFEFFWSYSPLEQKKQAWFKAATTNHVRILNAFQGQDSSFNWIELQDSFGNTALDCANKASAHVARLWLIEHQSHNSPNHLGELPSQIRESKAHQENVPPSKFPSQSNILPLFASLKNKS